MASEKDDPPYVTLDGGEGDEEDFDKEKWLESQDPDLQPRFRELFRNQDEVESAMKKFVEERRALEIKFLKDCEPKYQERRKLVAGENGAPAIENFWCDVLRSFQIFAEGMSDADLSILSHLQDIRCELMEPDPVDSEEDRTWGYRLTFLFEENPYFEGTELTKVYRFHDADETDLKEAVGCSIRWKPGKDPTKKVVKRTNKRGAVQRKAVPQESFFNFFSPPRIPKDLTAVNASIAQAIDLDFRKGTLLREDILLNAFRFFTGELEDEDADDEGEDEDDDDADDDDDEDDDDEDDDDDDDDGDGVGGGGKRIIAPKSGSKSAQQEQECKQQ